MPPSFDRLKKKVDDAKATAEAFNSVDPHQLRKKALEKADHELMNMVHHLVHELQKTLGGYWPTRYRNESNGIWEWHEGGGGKVPPIVLRIELSCNSEYQMTGFVCTRYETQCYPISGECGLTESELAHCLEELYLQQPSRKKIY